MLKRRTFECGCTYKGDDAIAWKSRRPMCPEHLVPVSIVEMKCKCGRWFRANIRGGNQKHCPACRERLYGAKKKKRPVNPDWVLTDSDKAFIRENRWLTYQEAADALGRPQETVRKYQREIGIPAKHPSDEQDRALERFFQEHQYGISP